MGIDIEPWRTEILAHYQTGASNGPTERLNLSSNESSAADTA